MGDQKALSRSDRISGGLIGLLVGDALGVPYEFYAASQIPAPDKIDFAPPPGFRPAHAGIAPGTWSDDGAQALCLLASLLHCDRFEPMDFGNRLINWHQVGYMAVDHHVFDIGMQTARAIGQLRAGVPPLEAGGDNESSQGNGSLMRVLPLVLWSKGSDADLVRDAHNQSSVTHRHIVVQVCCALYCLWARRILEVSEDPWSQAVEALRSIYQNAPKYTHVLEDEIRPDTDRVGRGTGYVLDCLFSAKAALEEETYEGVVKAAIGFGNDTDTTACLAGGLAGLRHGLSGIPERWRENLRGQDMLEPLLKRLIAQLV